MTFLGTWYFGNSIVEYGEFFLLLAVAVLAGKVVTWVTKRVLRAYSERTRTKADDILVDLLEGPVLFLIFIVALHFGQAMLSMSKGFASFYGKMVAVLFMINIGWLLIRFFDGLVEHYLAPLAAKTESDLDDHLIPILRRLVKIVIIIIIGIMALDKFNYNVASLLAGLGIGGLAFAFAAKDLVGNLFGGVAILLDKPFKLGDRIRIGDVDGFVREIGLRTTRVETLSKTMKILPNSKIVDSVVENVSAEPARKMTMTLGLEYGTTLAKMEKAKEIVKKAIKSTNGLSKDCIVAFSEFGDSSLNLFVLYWIEDMDRYWDAQDELNTSIKKEFEKEKIGFAFPSMTIYMRKG